MKKFEYDALICVFKREILLAFLFLGLSWMSSAQQGITFQVEELSKPERRLAAPSKELYERLILSDVRKIKKADMDFPFNIIAKSPLPDSLVHFGYHAFFNGMYQAYADHRPFVLSPDMIWLLISQGFARHVNANPEQLRPHFVDFSGKLSLIVSDISEKTLLEDADPSRWEKLFPQFTQQIAGHTGDELINLLTSDFSTTTSVERVASEITIMEATKPYFEFIVFYIICGIPEITLQGTTEDWKKIRDRIKLLEKYGLKWWTDELEPILNEFVNASQGKVDTTFWRNMFKYHTREKYGAPKLIDGWIVKFFPYDNKGKRNNLKELHGRGDNLPEEIVKVDLQYIDSETGVITPLELWAGFVGLEENAENLALTPKISWMIRKKDVNNTGLIEKLKADNKKTRSGGGIAIRVKEFPKELLTFKKIEQIEIVFLDEITIPDEFANINVKNMELSGQISEAGIVRIIKMFPDARIIINGKLVNGEPAKPLAEELNGAKPLGSQVVTSRERAENRCPECPNCQPSAFVYIDGKEGDISTLNPSDVEKFYVLEPCAVVINERRQKGLIWVGTKAKSDNANKDFCCQKQYPAAIYLNGKLQADWPDIDPSEIDRFYLLESGVVEIKDVVYEGLVIVETKTKE